ncbi:MAG TPA: O-methyltransferase [Candidatus Binatus sp.]|nr:O-methyltransferase [Candidatus Binatus sp.]
MSRQTMERDWSRVDHYINKLFVTSDPTLEAVLEASRAAGLPMINVSPSQGKLLQLLARAMNAMKILEVGTLGGYSTIWLARALPKTGRLITLEADPKHAKIAKANIAHAGLNKIVEIRLGNAGETLPQLLLEKKGPFDLIFIDADKPGYPTYLEWGLKLSRPGTLIIADNVVRDGEILDRSSKDMNVKGIRKFNRLLASEKRVAATAIQLVGTKGWDGMAVALVSPRF